MFALWLTRTWFQRRLSPALWFFVPLSWLYAALAAWQRQRVRAERLPVPVIVVGNLIVGGAGKTPLTLWLAEQLRAAGRRPGIVSRGYGATRGVVLAVSPETPPAEAGDEPVLLARRSGVPVFVGRSRAAAGRALLAAHPDVDVLICDDGLQHYRLARDVEIAVFDRRLLGNGWRLPAGPLREAVDRLKSVDAVVGNGVLPANLPEHPARFAMQLEPGDFYALAEPRRRSTAAELRAARRPLHALAGIGDPGRFFATLAGLGLECTTRAFPDHHRFTAADLAFAADGLLLMTEKDAVKCAALMQDGGGPEIWVLPVHAVLAPALLDLILEKIRGRTPA